MTAARNNFFTVAATLSLVLVWLVAWYGQTAAGMAQIWWRSDTFAHGLIVLPISAWLIWRKRAWIAPFSPQPVAWLAVPAALAGFAWLLGQLVSVNALAFLALVGMIVTAFVAALGWRLSRLLAFPILFLFFGVPIGEFLMPTLMDHTADFTVMALRLSGVPVYQEGLYFVIPNGRWSVVEACSGLRYLIASLMVGTLYAYLNYRSLTRRLLFVGVAIVVPIVANWLRAYLIVMLGYLSDNTVAAGVDHLIYGWVFFGVVILLMFWVGSFWREDVESAPPVSRSPEGLPDSTPARWLRLAPLAVVTAFFPLVLQQIERPVAPYSVHLELPEAATGWSRVDDSILGYRPEFSGHRAERFQAYRNEDGSVVGLYVAYYADQRENAELVAWATRVGSAEEDGWRVLRSRRDGFAIGTVLHTVVAKDANRVAIWHWYWTRRGILVSDAMTKAFLALDRLTGQADDAAFVAVFTPLDDSPEVARTRVASFVRDHGDGMILQLELVGTMHGD